MVALCCGLRPSEVLGLAWDAVELESIRPALTVRRGLKRIPQRGLVLSATKTNRSRRTILLTELAAQALRDHRARQAEAQAHAGEGWVERPLGANLIFRNAAGGAVEPAAFSSALAQACDRAELGHWTPHELRHSAASLLLAGGVPLVQVADFLGHSSAMVTAAVYAHVLDEARTATAVAMADALGG